MDAVNEGAGGIAKIFEVLKDLPLWLFVGLAGAAAALQWIPQFSASVPSSIRPWIVIVGIASAALALARALGLTVESARRWRTSVVARRTFHLTAISRQSHWSSARQSDDSTITQVSAHLLAKNLTQRPIALASCRLIRPKIWGAVVHEEVAIRAVDRNIYGTAADSGHFIPSQMSLPVSVHIMIRGVPWRKPKGEIRATISVKDDEGMEERIKIQMPVLPSAEAIAKPPALELVASISDPIERKVVAILQAELPRYEKFGRRVGGLGSVHLVIDGKIFPGAATDSWNPNSPKPQSIAQNPEVVELQSDNLEALSAVYSGLTNDEERKRFASALLDRINSQTGYASISYLIVCELWRIGCLPEALARAKSNLAQGEIKVFGLSNVLMLLNMLLRYRHPDFDDEDLDEIDRFLRGLNEHPFQIPEKIAAIRAMRLREPGARRRT